MNIYDVYRFKKLSPVFFIDAGRTIVLSGYYFNSIDITDQLVRWTIENNVSLYNMTEEDISILNFMAEMWTNG